ncbi:ATP-binding protein [Mycolicibacterium neworleansense]|uniref:RsbW protein n=1 Tax=Mycolicibacterium neworleansense TaxID=146018 RepID=A0A0H5RND9_9MYCO|nr:hypothetical protein [Mycolicibacterium neworleansense]MCV7364896.1 anti-sigma factor [Mycolicibacterium neworleansense]CRZ15690.1 RsbW protein [Mycolicibacterium neworleansense]
MELRVPARPDALAMVRAMTRCLANYEDLNGDTAANLELAVDEACTALIDMAPAGAALVLVEDPRARELNVRVSTACDGSRSHPDRPALSGFSRRVLEALTEKVETFVADVEHNGTSCPALGISLTIRRRWAAAGP